VYSTCIFCHASLGSNETIERFPVGRRIAFDAAKGRLWVVCRRCARWNLSPIETRWEAIEECERLFANTKLRISTDHIGLARARDGMDLVRIGEPKRPEMAAWRYGDQFGSRRRRVIALLAAGVSGPVVSLALLAGAATGVIPAMLAGIGGLGANLTATVAFLRLRYRRIRVRMRTAAGQRIRFSRSALRSLMLVRDNNTAFGWAVSVRRQPAIPHWLHLRPPRHPLAVLLLGGADALPALRVALPAINADGASAERLRTSVGILERLALPALLSENEKLGHGFALAAGAPMRLMNSPFRLAIEMALHEEDERRALEGELPSLETRWREAEEIAAIADDLLFPPNLRVKLEHLRRGH
jgi:hypothetical protein